MRWNVKPQRPLIGSISISSRIGKYKGGGLAEFGRKSSHNCCSTKKATGILSRIEADADCFGQNAR